VALDEFLLRKGGCSTTLTVQCLLCLQLLLGIFVRMQRLLNNALRRHYLARVGIAGTKKANKKAAAVWAKQRTVEIHEQ
jgi:hypothetical protein